MTLAKKSKPSTKRGNPKRTHHPRKLISQSEFRALSHPKKSTFDVRITFKVVAKILGSSELGLSTNSRYPRTMDSCPLSGGHFSGSNVLQYLKGSSTQTNPNQTKPNQTRPNPTHPPAPPPTARGNFWAATPQRFAIREASDR